MRLPSFSKKTADQDVVSGSNDPTDQSDSITPSNPPESAVIAGSLRSTNVVSLPGSAMVFANTFGSGVTAAFKAAVTAAENYLQAHFTNAVTLNCSFDLSVLDPGFSGQNSYRPVNVSYASLEAALASHATTTDDRSAVASLPVSDPSGGLGFAVATGEARILGLAAASSAIDDTIVLNSSLPWTYGQDAIGVLEHEITEGCMGRVGGLGLSNPSSGWGPLDLFRYSSPGRRDYTGGADGLPTFFSADGQTLTIQFHNAISPAGLNDGFDLGDWDHTQGDAFGPGGPGGPGTMSKTDLQVMDVLGWTPTTVVAPVDLSASASPVTFNLETLTASSSFGRTPIRAGGGTLIGSVSNDSLIVGTNEGTYTFDGRLGSNTVSVDGVGRTAAVISGNGATGLTIAITGTTIGAFNTARVQFIDGSVEYDPAGPGAQVMRLYQAALGRLPDAPGLAYWADGLAAGVQLTSLAQSFIDSPEFQARFPELPRDSSGFITQLYENVLHRAPDAPGLANWNKALGSGSMTTAQVLVGFSESREHTSSTLPLMQNGLYVANQQAAQVARLYYTTFGRAPDFGGFQSWAGELQSGQMTLLQAADSFSNSPEFLASHSTLDNTGFVDLLYSNVLHRAADHPGEAVWVSALNEGSLTRGGVVLGFSQSQELITALSPVIENRGITFL